MNLASSLEKQSSNTPKLTPSVHPVIDHPHDVPIVTPTIKKVAASSLAKDNIAFENWRKGACVYKPTDPEYEDVITLSEIKKWDIPSTDINLDPFWEALDTLVKYELAQVEPTLTRSEQEELRKLLDPLETNQVAEKVEEDMQEKQKQSQSEETGMDEGKEAEATVVAKKLHFLPIARRMNEGVRRIWLDKHAKERTHKLRSAPAANAYTPPTDLLLMSAIANVYLTIQRLTSRSEALNEATWGSCMEELFKHVWVTWGGGFPVNRDDIFILREADVFIVCEQKEMEIVPDDYRTADYCTADMLAWMSFKEYGTSEHSDLVKWFRLQQYLSLGLFGVEYKKFDPVEALHQLMLDLTAGASANEIAGVDLPLFGFVLTASATQICFCKARKRPDKTMAFGFQTLADCGGLEDIENFATIFGYICSHKAWIMRKLIPALGNVMERYGNLTSLLKIQGSSFKPWRRLDFGPGSSKRGADGTPEDEKEPKKGKKSMKDADSLPDDLPDNLAHNIETVARDPRDGNWKEARYLYGRLIFDFENEDVVSQVRQAYESCRDFEVLPEKERRLLIEGAYAMNVDSDDYEPEAISRGLL